MNKAKLVKKILREAKIFETPKEVLRAKLGHEIFRAERWASQGHNVATNTAYAAAAREVLNSNCLEGKRCPDCGNQDEFRVQATVVAVVTDDGACTLASDVEYDEGSYARCPRCDKEGTWGDFDEGGAA